MNYNISGIQIIYFLGIIAVSLIILILFLKNIILNKRNIISDIKKNIFTFRRSILLFSYVLSITIVLIIFNWTTESNAMMTTIVDIPNIDEIEVEIPITREEPKKIPPPPVMELIPEEQIIEEDQPEFIPSDINIDDAVEAPEEYFADIPQAMPKAETKEDIPEIVTFAEEMPLFPGCNEIFDKNERRNCATKKLYEYIYSNLKYPKVAQEAGIEGKVVLKFAVDKNGDVSKVNILRDIGGGCGKAASNTILSMKRMKEKWTPGKQAGRPVNIWFTLPITFKLTK